MIRYGAIKPAGSEMEFSSWACPVLVGVGFPHEFHTARQTYIDELPGSNSYDELCEDINDEHKNPGLKRP